MAGVSMEIDPPTSSSSSNSNSNESNNPGGVGGTLKRSSSAPMINLLNALPPVPPASPTSHMNRATFRPIESGRVRRFSTSSSVLPHSSPPMKIPSRLHQIKHEESIDMINREAAHERDVQAAMQMSQSWEELSLDEQMASETPARRPRSFSETLHIFTSPLSYPSSPSPTRVGKQCFSPSTQSAHKGSALHSPNPSPTRKFSGTRRSLSPIVPGIIRPSILGAKRKFDPDEQDAAMSPPKKSCMGTGERATHPLLYRVSRQEDSSHCGSQQQMPNSSHHQLSNDSTGHHHLNHPAGPHHLNHPSQPHQLSHSQHSSFTSTSSNFTFKPVPMQHDHTATDSEASDITENTDTSENTESSMSSSARSSSSPLLFGFAPVKQTQV
ncbi:protein FAM122A isoform X1 [Lingula anatina]|uniref:Protein FAM122A isoform X1 n=1 Tax=Lingula anatina TaxID=7574 RepID=A0A1S3K074_LINAN|nr:protein FAM122A isoform X1 [Lingula anatina]|eukprot:XP_013415942.1 protein FAM122A isoform X1 [Lingula anatina]